MIQLTSKSLILLMLILVCSCSVISPYKVPIIQGNIWEEDDIEKLNAGLTKEQVQFIFGTAVIIDPFRTSRWDYINSVQIGEKIVQENKLTVFLILRYPILLHFCFSRSFQWMAYVRFECWLFCIHYYQQSLLSIFYNHLFLYLMKSLYCPEESEN